MVRRQTIVCPKCNAVGSLRGVAPSPTSMLAVQCSSCSVSVAMADIQVCLPDEPVASQDASEKPTTSDHDKEFKTLRAELSTMRESLRRTIELYELRSAQIISETGKRESFFFPLPIPPKAQPDAVHRPPTPTEAEVYFSCLHHYPNCCHCHQDPLPTTWAEKTKTHLPPRKKSSAARPIAACVRLFQKETGPSGYTYIYLHRNRRMQTSEARSSLRRLGLEPSRLLEITMPTRNIIGLLVH
ncbi:unnamed protein product [Umbelopsis ramanniana]